MAGKQGLIYLEENKIFMTSNRKIISMIQEFTSMHELTGETFKMRSYQKAAKILSGIDQPIESMSKDELMELDGIGNSIASKIIELVENGEVSALKELHKKTPAGLREVMSIEGVGPKTAKMLYDKLGIDSVDKLEDAIKAGKLQGIKGIGEKTVENMLDGIERYRRSEGRSPRAQVLPVADEIVSKLLEQFPDMNEISVAGSLRRKKETIGDIDILIQSAQASKIMEYFTSMSSVERVLASGGKKSSVIVEGDMQLDLRVIEGPAYYSHLQYFTGSKEHNIRMRQLAIDQGYLLNEYGLFKDDNPVDLKGEATIYETLGLVYIQPELREDRGEIEAAKENQLPDLITYENIRADFHVHSRPDDPSLRDKEGSMEDMIEEAIKRGLEYLVFTDHTQDLTMVFGLDDDEILTHAQKIRDLNKSYKEIELFCGAELNIREDGTVDLETNTLAELDFVIASIHSNFKMTEKKMTERLMSAMDLPQVKAIAHPTAREFRKRDPIELDFEQIVNHAIKTNTALEINGGPSRMDLSDTIIHQYRNTDLTFTLGSDAHLPYQMSNLDFAVDQARRGWLIKDQVLNSMPLDQFKNFIRS